MTGMTPDLADLNALMPYAVLLGIEIDRAEPEEVRGRMAWAAERCTSGGALHGGVLMGFADSLGGLSAYLNLPEGAVGTTTIESKTNFFRAVRQGQVHAVTRPLHAGRTTVVVQSDLRDDAGKLVAQTTQTQAVLRG